MSQVVHTQIWKFQKSENQLSQNLLLILIKSYPSSLIFNVRLWILDCANHVELSTHMGLLEINLL